MKFKIGRGAQAQVPDQTVEWYFTAANANYYLYECIGRLICNYELRIFFFFFEFMLFQANSQRVLTHEKYP